MRVLVTGASGFVGRQAVAALGAAGAEVHAIARRPVPCVASCHGIDLLADAPSAALRRLPAADVLLHCAWSVEPGRFWTDPLNDRWVDASVALAEAAIATGVCRIVAIGTCWEYGWPADGLCREDATPIVPHTRYDAAKSRLRARLEEVAAATGIGFVWARLFFPFGEGDDPRRLLGGVARGLVCGESVPCSRGLAARDFVDVAEAGRALAALVAGTASGTVNIGSGVGIRVRDLVERLAQLAGRPELPAFGALPDRADEPPAVIADLTRLRDWIGFVPAGITDDRLRRLLEEAAG